MQNLLCVIDQIKHFDMNKASLSNELDSTDLIGLPHGNHENSDVEKLQLSIKCNYDYAYRDYIKTYAEDSNSLTSLSELSELHIVAPCNETIVCTSSISNLPGNPSPPALLIQSTTTKRRFKKVHSKLSQHLYRNIIHPQNEPQINLKDAWNPISEGTLAFQVDSSIPKPPYIERQIPLKNKTKQEKFRNKNLALNLDVNSNEENTTHSQSLDTSTIDVSNHEISHDLKTNDIHQSTAPNIINGDHVQTKCVPQKPTRWPCKLV